ncbi:MAG: polymer-forming cytoskeletal protein [Idiomarina sp.]|nr:polymer-forming cytoskeletal protein [Idiomarina sp.]
MTLVKWSICAALFFVGTASANWTLPADAVDNVGPFGSCTFDGDQQVTCNNVSLNDTNATLQLTQDLTLVVNSNLVLPQGINVNPNADFTFVIELGNNALNTNSGSIIEASVNAGNITLSGSGSEIRGNLSASSSIIVNSGAQVFGNVTAPSITNNWVINGTVSAATFTNNSGAIVSGNVTASGSVMNNGTISANVTSAGTVTNNSDGVIGSINALGSVTNNGTVLGYINAPTISGSGSVGQTCDINDNQGPCGGSQDSDFDYCSSVVQLTSFGIVGSGGFTYGSNSSINDNNISGSGNTPTPSGSVDTVDLEYPPLDPEVYPTFSSTTNLSNANNIAPGTYNEIDLRGNNTFSFTGGGTYYIKRLVIGRTGNSTTVNFGPGDYFIEELELNSNDNVVIPGGPVRWFIRNSIGRANANQLNINSTGNVTDLQIFLYEGAQVNLGNGNQGNQSADTLNFNGLIYGPYTSNQINLGNNNNIQGSILSAGTVNVGNNTVFNYSTEVEEQITASLGCAPQAAEIHHYRILHPQSLVSCFAAPITVRACANASCTELFQSDAAVNLNASGLAPTWQGGNVTQTAGSTATLEFSNGTGTAGLRNIPGGTVSLSISEPQPIASDPVQCFDTTGAVATNCNVDFSTAGLVFTGADGVSPIPASHAGLPFDVALRAVQTNTTTGACQARVQGTQTVNLGVECVDPQNCASGQSYRINGNEIGLNSLGNLTNLTAQSLTFDANGTALLPHQYSDVGRLRLQATMTLPGEPSSTPGVNNPTVTLSGSSINNFVSRPHTLAVQAVDNNGELWTTTTDSGAGLQAAGAPFTLAVQSLNAQGQPTPSFGNEQTSLNLTVAIDSLAYPSGGETGTLNLSQSFTASPSIPGALQSSNVTWSEVGTINLVAQLGGNSYLGAGDALNRQASPIGRFYPDRFEIVSSLVLNGCAADNFTYMGQPAIGVDYRIRALSATGSVTRNYSENYVGRAEVGLVAAHLDPADTTEQEFATRMDSFASSSWLLGEIEFSADDVAFQRAADNQPDGPYPETVLGIEVLDEIDDRGFPVASQNLTTATGTAVLLNGVLDLRYGRLVLDNTYGPESEPLPVAMRAEYWDGERFIRNPNDFCTDFSPSDLVILSNPDGLATVSDGALDNLTAGQVPSYELFWTPANERGEFVFEYQAPSWLQFDWVLFNEFDGTESNFSNPRATGSFGQFRGNDRIIYWLERGL